MSDQIPSCKGCGDQIAEGDSIIELPVKTAEISDGKVSKVKPPSGFEYIHVECIGVSSNDSSESNTDSRGGSQSDDEEDNTDEDSDDGVNWEARLDEAIEEHIINSDKDEISEEDSGDESYDTIKELDKDKPSDELFKDAIVNGTADKRLLANAIVEYFYRQEPNTLYIKSRDVSSDIDHALSAKQISHGFSFLDNNSPYSGVEVEAHSYTQGTTWKVTEHND